MNALNVEKFIVGANSSALALKLKNGVFHLTSVPDTNDMGAKIRFHRNRQGLSQKQIAGLCGLSQPTVCRIENNPLNAKLEDFVLICHALGISVNDILEWDKFLKRKNTKNT